MKKDNADMQIQIEKIYYEYRNLIYWIANGILNDEDLAEEAVHDTILKIIKYPYGIDMTNANRTKNYIVKVARNISYDLYNKHKKNINTSIDSDPMIILEAKEDSNPEKFVISNESVKELMEEINKMDTKYGDPLRLQRIENLSISQIAEILGISKRTVSNRIETARRILKIKLRKADE